MSDSSFASGITGEEKVTIIHSQTVLERTLTMVIIQTAFLIGLVGLSNACETTVQAKDVQHSGNLDNHRSLLERGQNGRVLPGYRNLMAYWPAYSKVMLEPVTISEGLSSKLRNQEHHALVLLTGSFEDKLYMKLSKEYEMVERPTAGAMLIQVAITHPEEHSTTSALWSHAAQALQAVATIYTLAGTPPFAGEFATEFKIRDAQTGELLAAGVDRVAEERHHLGREISSSWCDVENGLEAWTDLSLYRLCVLRGASNCVESAVRE